MAARPIEPSPARHVVHDGKDMVIVLGVALLAVVGLGTWLWGEAAGLLTHGAFPGVSVSQSIAIVRRLPRHLSDPRAAWPPEATNLLPGPAPFYCAGAGTVVLTAVFVLAGTRAW